MWAVWLLLGALLSIRGLMVAIEVALQAVSEARARELATESPRRGRRLLKVKVDPEGTAAALRLGTTLAGFSAAAVGVMMHQRLVGVPLELVAPTEWLFWLSPLSSALLVALLATLFDVAFRSAAVQKPEAWAMQFSGVALISMYLLAPVLKVLVAPVNIILRPFHAKVTFQPPPPPLEELEKQLIRQAQKHEIDKGAPQLIRSIFELTDKTCRDVMVPRTEVVTVDLATPVPDIIQLIAEQGHSRLPVYRQDVDRIAGILHVRDMVPLIENPTLIVLEDLLRPAVFVPWVKPIGDLLRDMQRQRIHMAVVVDEYGGFSGIVTLEDILREIVGDIGDEFDEDEKAFEKQPDGSYLVDAVLPRAEFARSFDFRFPEGDFETLGGFLSHLAGAIPEIGERFSANGFTFVVHSKEGPKLERVKVLKPRPPPSETSRTISRETELVPVRSS